MSYQSKTILRVLSCSKRDLRPDLAPTVIGRQGIEVYRVEKVTDAKLVASSLGVQVILVDRDLPDAANFIRQLRKEPTTRKRSIGVLVKGPLQNSDRDLIAAGANAVFPLPPDSNWEARFTKLLDVPVRQQARIVVHIKTKTEPECAAAILNLSPGGMLLATHRALHKKDEIGFRFDLPEGATVVGRGRVARETPPTGFGVEFVAIEGEGKGAVQEFLRASQHA